MMAQWRVQEEGRGRGRGRVNEASCAWAPLIGGDGRGDGHRPTSRPSLPSSCLPPADGEGGVSRRGTVAPMAESPGRISIGCLRGCQQTAKWDLLAQLQKVGVAVLGCLRVAVVGGGLSGRVSGGGSAVCGRMGVRLWAAVHHGISGWRSGQLTGLRFRERKKASYCTGEIPTVDKTEQNRGFARGRISKV